MNNPINSNQTIYPVNEIFNTIQGEAKFTGTPSIFIRMQGCDVGCAWCDTKHTWEKNITNRTDFIELTNKTKESNTWANITLHELVEYIKTTYPTISHVVITGGEPAIYNLTPLCMELEKIGKYIQIETSGTASINVTPSSWVTLSPKINMPNQKPLIKSAVLRANEIKMPIGKKQDIEKLKQFLHEYNTSSNIDIWLQPLSTNPSATSLCIEEAMKNNWKISIQTHKYINIR